jgi:perosamine synthetase
MKEFRGINGDGISYDYGMTDFQGAMGISQLFNLIEFIKRRREIAKVYLNALKMTTHKTPYAYSDLFAYQSFPIIFDAPSDKVEKYWRKCGIEIVKPVHKPLHGILNFKSINFPNSERLSKKLYSLPIYPTLTKKEIDKVAKALANFI